MSLYTKGECVEYMAGKQRVRAIVRTRHIDGTVTVEAQHFLDDGGKVIPGYLGFKYRLSPRELRYSI